MKISYAVQVLVAVAAANVIPAQLDKRATCEANGTLAQPYVTPSLIVQTSKKNPDKQYGSTKHPKITPNDLCADINLQLPGSAWDKICRLSFKIPSHAQTHARYNYSGGGHFSFSGYLTGFGANINTTYNNQPIPGPSPNAPPNISPGHSYTLLQFFCGFPPGLKTVTVGGQLCSNDTSFDWVNSDAKCPLGFFVEILDINSTTLGGIVL